MHIQVKLFASLGIFAPHGKAATIFPYVIDEGTNLNMLVNLLNIPDEQVKICFINGLIREMDYVLQEADEVGIFPPIGGGSNQ